MPRTILWLGAVLGVGWFCSDAFAFGLLARLRNGQGNVVSADTPAPPGTTIENGQITNGDAVAYPSVYVTAANFTGGIVSLYTARAVARAPESNRGSPGWTSHRCSRSPFAVIFWCS